MFSVFIIYGIVILLLIAWMARFINLAFIQNKDERKKTIAIQSMAQAFVFIILVDLLWFILKAISIEPLDLLLLNIQQAIQIDPAVLYLVVLELTMFINRKISRH